MNNPAVRAEPHARPAGLSRRAALKTGAVGGVLLWSVPTVQVLGISAATADDPSGPPPPPPPPPPEGTLPSHGFVLVVCGDGVFGVKIESSGSLGALGMGNDVPFLAEKGLILGVDYRQATSDDLADLAGSGIVGFTIPGSNPEVIVPAMFITLGAGCSFFDGYSYVFDGSFQTVTAGGEVKKEGCGDGDKFTKAFVAGNTVYFAAVCHEPATGEEP